MRAALALGLLAGCAGREPGPLVDHEAWTWVEAAADPLSEHRPNPVDCAPTEWRVEAGALEVETSACNYAALSQPLARPVDEGAPLRVIAWHSTLDAAEVGEAHVAILLAGHLVWERFVPIPSAPGAMDDSFDSPVAANEGDPVVLHLHNHGDNAWTFLSFEVSETN